MYISIDYQNSESSKIQWCPIFFFFKLIYFKLNQAYTIIFSVNYLLKVTSKQCRHVEDKAMRLIGHLFRRLIALCCYQWYAYVPLSILYISIVFRQGHWGYTTPYKMPFLNNRKRDAIEGMEEIKVGHSEDIHHCQQCYHNGFWNTAQHRSHCFRQ